MTDATRPTLAPSQIATLAGVDSSTVSNWRRRHPDFPAPSGGSQRRPLFDREAIVVWLSVHGKSTTAAPRQTFADPSYASSSASQLAVVGAVAGWQLGIARDVPGSGPLSRLGSLSDEISESAYGTRPALSDFLRSLAQPEGQLDAEFREVLLLAAECVSGLDAGVLEALNKLNRASREDATALTVPVALTALDQNRDRVAEELGTHTGLSVFGNSLLNIDDVSTVLDVAAGRGDFLATAAERYPTAKLTGIEPDELLAAATRLRLALVGRGVDVIRTPVPEADLQFERYDIVFCDPPLSSAALWAPERVAALPFGPPPLNQHSLGWIEYITPLISKRGVGVVVTGSDVLGEFANGEDSVRRALITSSAVSAIMSLPRGLRTSSTAPLAMWILEAPDDDRASYIRDSVLMLDARESAPTELLGDGFAKMYRQFTEREDEKYGPDYSPGESGDRSDTVSRADLASPGVVIEPPYWIAPHRGTETWRSDPLDQYYNDLDLALRISADAPIVLEQTKVHARIAPRVVTIGELVDAGLLTVLRGWATAKDDDFVWWSRETRVVTSKVLFSRRNYNARGGEFTGGPVATEEGLTPIGDRDVVLGRANTGFLAVPFASSGTWALGRGMQALQVSEALDPRYVAESICSQWNDRHEALYDASARSDIRRYEVALLPLEEQTRSMDRLYELRQTHNRLRNLVSWLESADGELRDALTRGNLIAGETTQMLRLTKSRRPKQGSTRSTSEPKEKS